MWFFTSLYLIFSIYIVFEYFSGRIRSFSTVFDYMWIFYVPYNKLKRINSL